MSVVAGPEARLAALNGISRVLLAELELDEVLRLTLDKVRELFGVPRCAVLQVDENIGKLKLLKSVGYDEGIDAQFTLEVGEGISGWVARNGLPAFVPDVASDPRYVPGVTGAVSEIAVPLMRRGKAVGVLDIESTTPLRQEDFDMDFLSFFASLCAVALYNSALVSEAARHREELERRVRELQVLNHIGKLLGQLLPLDDVLREILRMANEVLSFRACAVLLPEAGDQNVLRVRAAVGYPPDVLERVRIRRGEAVTGRVFQNGIPRLVEDVTKLPDYVPGTVGGRCEMACPLVARSRVLGVLDAEGDTPGCFDEHQFVLFCTFASQAAIAIKNAQMLERQQAVYYQTISSLASALEARDSYTRGHSERVTRMALDIGRRMGMGHEELDIVRQAGLLHDIGKIGITDGVLNKPGGLSPEERGEIEHHPRFGNDILGQIGFLREASRSILHHHERFDGSGYPASLTGPDIPLVARIIAVADAWDAMTSHRPYREAMAEESALTEIVAHCGTQFDPAVVREFLAIVGREDLMPA